MQCWEMCQRRGQRRQFCRYICEDTGCTTDKQCVSRWEVRMPGQFHVLSTTIRGLGMLSLTLGWYVQLYFFDSVSICSILSHTEKNNQTE